MKSAHQYRHRHLRPGLWDEALRQWPASCGPLTPQTPQPAQAQPPQAARAAWRRDDGAQQGAQSGQRWRRGPRPDFQSPAHTPHPQRRDGPGHPEAGGPSGRAPLGLWPLPAAALATLPALCTPAPQPIPDGLAAFGCPIGQEQPWVGVALTPPCHHCTVPPPLRRDTGRPLAAPPLVDGPHQLAEPLPPRRPRRAERGALVDPQPGMPAQADHAPEAPARPPAPVGQPQHGPLWGDGRAHLPPHPPPFAPPRPRRVGQHPGPGDRDGTAPRHDTDRQHPRSELPSWARRGLGPSASWPTRPPPSATTAGHTW
jgi:hypothetical protein